MKFKLLIFALIFSSLPLCAMDHPSELDTELVEAVKAGNIEEIESCLIRGANIEMGIPQYSLSGTEYITPLMLASKDGYIEIVKLLLKHHANVYAIDGTCWTSLMYAANSGYTAIVKLLLDYHATVNDSDTNGMKALLLAAQNGHLEIVKLLIKHGAHINTVNHDRKTALALASDQGYATIVHVLLKHGAHIDTIDKNDSSPLKHATSKNHLEIVKLILKHINHLLDQTDDSEIFQELDQYILDSSFEDSFNHSHLFHRYMRIKGLNIFRMLLHHADKLPLSRKKLKSLTLKALRERHDGEKAFKETIKHIRKEAF